MGKTFNFQSKFFYRLIFRATVCAGLLAGIMASMFELKNLVDMMVSNYESNLKVFALFNQAF